VQSNSDFGSYLLKVREEKTFKWINAQLYAPILVLGDVLTCTAVFGDRNILTMFSARIALPKSIKQQTVDVITQNIINAANRSRYIQLVLPENTVSTKNDKCDGGDSYVLLKFSDRQWLEFMSQLQTKPKKMDALFDLIEATVLKEPECILRKQFNNLYCDQGWLPDFWQEVSLYISRARNDYPEQLGKDWFFQWFNEKQRNEYLRWRNKNKVRGLFSKEGFKKGVDYRLSSLPSYPVIVFSSAEAANIFVEATTKDKTQRQRKLDICLQESVTALLLEKERDAGIYLWDVLRHIILERLTPVELAIQFKVAYLKALAFAIGSKHPDLRRFELLRIFLKGYIPEQYSEAMALSSTKAQEIPESIFISLFLDIAAAIVNSGELTRQKMALFSAISLDDANNVLQIPGDLILQTLELFHMPVFMRTQIPRHTRQCLAAKKGVGAVSFKYNDDIADLFTKRWGWRN
jgi:hypothetical protein